MITKATKYKRVRWNPARIRKMYRAGNSVSEIARAIGYPRGHGQNRVRGLLERERIYKAA